MIHFFALPLPEPPVAYRETDHTREKKAHTRQRLLSAARDIVAAEGFAAATAAAVAARSGVAAGTIYRHFPASRNWWPKYSAMPPNTKWRRSLRRPRKATRWPSA